MRTRRRLAAQAACPTTAIISAVLPLLLAITPEPAQASEDIDCYPDLKIAHAAFTRCNLMTAINPGNDTRATLLLLLLDRDGLPARAPPAPPLPAGSVPLLFWQDFRDHFVASAPKPAPGFAEGEGSRCRSNVSGAAAFAAAVAAARMPDEDRASLLQARKDLRPTCSGNSLFQPAATHSATGQAFATYLNGIGSFYAGRFDEAVAAFAALHGTADAWLGDTADYMAARTQVNALQAGATFDDYGGLASSNHVAPATADRARASLEAYLRGHPDGAYAASARGLERRVDWIGDRTEALAAGYDEVVARPPSQRGVDDAALAEEIADKFLPVAKPTMIHDPILLAALDLASMRPLRGNDDIDDDNRVQKGAPQHIDLEAQRADFNSAMPLFDFVAATQAYYLDHDPAQVMKLVPDDTHRRDGNHLWFARQVLRGLALEARGDRNARGFWKELFAVTDRPLDRLTVQLGLAMHDERMHTLEDVFAPGSIVTSPAIRDVLIENDGDAALLRRVAHDESTPEPESSLALSTLLWKEVTRGHDADFIADLRAADGEAAAEPFQKSYPGEIGCPALAATAAQLAADTRRPRARLCLAEFVRTSGLFFEHYSAGTFSSGATPDDLGGVRSMFPGNPYDRATTYSAIIADKAAPADDRAFALYRAILCWAPSGVNDCGGLDVPKAQRAAWYKTLKRDHPTSRWAKALAYWW